MPAGQDRKDRLRRERDLEQKVADLERREREWRERRRYYERAHAEFTALMENTDDFILISDENGVPRRFNSAYARIMREVLGIRMKPGIQPHKLLEDPESVAFWDGLHRRVLDGESFRAEFSVPFGDSGEVRHFECSFYPIREGNTVAGFTEITREITDRKRMEQDLHRALVRLEEKVLTRTDAERQYRGLFENAVVGIYRATREGVLLKVNPRCADIFGYRSPEHMMENVTRTHQFYAHPSSRGAVMDKMKRSGFVKDVAIESRTRTGRPLWINVSAREVKQPDGSVVLEGFLQDVTQQQTTAESLRRSEAHLRSLMENASGFVVYRLVGENTAPAKLRVVFISPSAADVLGVSEPERFESWFEQLHPDDVERVAEANRRAHLSGRFEGQFRFYHHGLEQWRWIHAISSGGVEGPGSQFYVNGIMVDITDKKETEMALQRREQDLKQKAAALEELNTALRVVIEKKSEDQENFEKKLMIHARMLIQPYIEKLRNTNLSGRQDGLLNILESNLDEIFSGLPKRMSSAFVGLTRQETQIASLIRRGKTSRQIAAMLDLSPRTIDTHRANLRRKLGLKSKKTNLRSYLLSLQE